MPFDTKRHRRRSIRLRGYDYRSAGAYFVTVCTHDWSFMLYHLALRQIVQTTWQNLPERFPSIALDEFVIMPNHVHFIIWIHKAGASPAAVSLGDVVGTFKSLIARGWLGWIRTHMPEQSARVWQRNYLRTRDPQ